MGFKDDHPFATHTASIGFPFYFDYDEGITWGQLITIPPWRLPYDMIIYYKSDTERVGGWCSRWDVQDYSVIATTWLKQEDLQEIQSNVRPGAIGELNMVIARPRYYDHTFEGKNTIKLKPHPSSNLSKMRSEVVGFVKNITTSPITNTDWTEIKLECIISGQQSL